MPEEKKSNKERLKEITDSIEAGIKELFESEKYQQYLQTMSRFHRYSVNNTMLIYMQKPDATLVAGFNKWRDQFERNVNKGERGIKIIAPTPYKKKIEEQKLDPDTRLPMLDADDTRLPMLDADGKVIMEEKEIKIPMYKPVTVFDVSQTSGKPLPQLANDLSGNVQDYEAFMEAIRRASPVPIEIKPIARGMDGFFSPEEQSITLREGMSEVQTVCAAIHERAKYRRYALPSMRSPIPSCTIMRSRRKLRLPQAKMPSRLRKKTDARRKWRQRAFPIPFVLTMESPPVKTASATSPHGQRTRSCRSSGPVWKPSTKPPLNSLRTSTEAMRSL